MSCNVKAHLNLATINDRISIEIKKTILFIHYKFIKLPCRSLLLTPFIPNKPLIRHSENIIAQTKLNDEYQTYFPTCNKSFTL